VISVADLLEDIADSLAAVLPEQRWFAGKGRPVHAIIPVRATDLAGADPRLVHAVVEVDQGEQPRDRYQLLLGVRGDLPENLGHAWVAACGDRAVYQAVHDPELTAVLLDLMAQGKEVDGLRFAAEPGVTLDTEQRSRPVGAEQSNTSLVYGQTYILKLFRKVVAGRNPDLEMHRALAAVGCPHIAAPLGDIEGELQAAPVTYGAPPRAGRWRRQVCGICWRKACAPTARLALWNTSIPETSAAISPARRTGSATRWPPCTPTWPPRWAVPRLPPDTSTRWPTACTTG
jgi:maltokinase